MGENKAERSSPMSLKEMLVEQAILLEDIMGSEISEDQENKLITLEAQLPWKVDAWIGVLKNGGTLDFYKEKLKERIEEIEEAIESIDDEKQKKLQYLHSLLTEMNLEKLDGNELYMKKDVSIKSTVNLPDVEHEYRKYDINGITGDEYYLLIDILNHSSVLKEKQDLLISLTQKIREAEPRCGVKDLPEGHKAIKKSMTPTVRFYKKPIKQKRNGGG